MLGVLGVCPAAWDPSMHPASVDTRKWVLGAPEPPTPNDPKTALKPVPNLVGRETSGGPRWRQMAKGATFLGCDFPCVLAAPGGAWRDCLPKPSPDPPPP